MGDKVHNTLPKHWVCQKKFQTVFYREVNILSITAYTLLSKTANVLQIT